MAPSAGTLIASDPPDYEFRDEALAAFRLRRRPNISQTWRRIPSLYAPVSGPSLRPSPSSVFPFLSVVRLSLFAR